MRYKLTAAVWQDGSGWQPHGIADRYADTFAEALQIARKLVAIGDPMGDVQVTITGPTGATETIG